RNGYRTTVLDRDRRVVRQRGGGSRADQVVAAGGDVVRAERGADRAGEGVDLPRRAVNRDRDGFLEGHVRGHAAEQRREYQALYRAPGTADLPPSRLRLPLRAATGAQAFRLSLTRNVDVGRGRERRHPGFCVTVRLRAVEFRPTRLGEQAGVSALWFRFAVAVSALISGGIARVPGVCRVVIAHVCRGGKVGRGIVGRIVGAAVVIGLALVGGGRVRIRLMRAGTVRLGAVLRLVVRGIRVRILGDTVRVRRVRLAVRGRLVVGRAGVERGRIPRGTGERGRPG